MKKILFTLAAVTASLGFSSCDETWDNNPVIATHDGIEQATFLNQPEMGQQEVMLTAGNTSGYFHLSCSQPYYGSALVVTYQVQCSLTPDFAEFYSLKDEYYDCADINPLNGNVASAIEYLNGVINDDDLPLPYQPLYMRLYAYVNTPSYKTGTYFTNDINSSPSEIYKNSYMSNVVAFKGVSANYLAIWVSGQPANLYLRGGMNEWGAPEAYQFFTGELENNWETGVVTIPAGTEFKVADAEWAPINLGENGDPSITPNVAYELTLGDNPGNLKMSEDFEGKAYLVLDKNKYTLTLVPSGASSDDEGADSGDQTEESAE